MKFTYYPAEITNAICKKIGEADKAKITDIIDAVYQLKTLCENEYNSDYYRTFYKALEELTEVLEAETN